MQEAHQAMASRRKPIPAAKTPETSQAHQQAVQQYQSALQLMQQGKFDKARTLFEKLIASGPVELVERSRVYLAACVRNGQESALTFANPGERYDYAISQLNTGYYEEAREHFEAILREDAQADYAYYGLAIMESMTGQAEECLEHLKRAIELNPQNRIQARSDSDFEDMADDPRFTELLYPEIP